MQTKWLVRYGVIPEVARFWANDLDSLERDARVVIHSPRGLEIGTLLQKIPVKSAAGAEETPAELEIVRLASSADEATDREMREECQVG